MHVSTSSKDILYRKWANSCVTCDLTPQCTVFFEKLVVCPAGRLEVLHYSIHTISFKILYYRLHKGPPLGPILRLLAVVTPVCHAWSVSGGASLELCDILPPDKMWVVSLSHPVEEAWCTLGAWWRWHVRGQGAEPRSLWWFRVWSGSTRA